MQHVYDSFEVSLSLLNMQTCVSTLGQTNNIAYNSLTLYWCMCVKDYVSMTLSEMYEQQCTNSWSMQNFSITSPDQPDLPDFVMYTENMGRSGYKAKVGVQLGRF